VASDAVFNPDAKVVFDYNGKSVVGKFLRGCRARDYAVFEYDPSLNMGSYKLAKTHPTGHFPGTVIGFDNGGMQVMQSNGMVRIEGDDIKHYCSTVCGASGGPIFDSNARVVGVHQAGAYSGNIGLVVTDALLDGNTVCSCDVCQYSESKRKRRGNAASNGRVNAMDHPEDEKKKNEKPKDSTQVNQVRPPLEIPLVEDSDGEEPTGFEDGFVVWGDDIWVLNWWRRWLNWLEGGNAIVMSSEIQGWAQQRRLSRLNSFVNQRSL